MEEELIFELSASSSDDDIVLRPTYINFEDEAIDVIRLLSPHLRTCDLVVNSMTYYDPLNVEGLTDEFERKLAHYIWINIGYTSRMMVESRQVIETIAYLVVEGLYRKYIVIGPEGTVDHMLSGYPLKILSQVCQADLNRCHLIGECVRDLVARQYIPTDRLVMMTQGCTFIPLVGDPKSPLNQEELDALYDYLGIRKQSFVHLLLNGLYDFRDGMYDIDPQKITLQELVKICSSDWFHLLTV